MDSRTSYWIVLALAASPILLLLVAWYRSVSLSSPAVGRSLRLILLVVATSSHIWLVLGMWFPVFWGDYHTNVRFAILDVNFAVMLGCSITAFWSKGNGKVLLLIAGVLTTLLWSVEAAINSTV
jgi:hypothetical protein